MISWIYDKGQPAGIDWDKFDLVYYWNIGNHLNQKTTRKKSTIRSISRSCITGLLQDKCLNKQFSPGVTPGVIISLCNKLIFQCQNLFAYFPFDSMNINVFLHCGRVTQKSICFIEIPIWKLVITMLFSFSGKSSTVWPSWRPCIATSSERVSMPAHSETTVWQQADSLLRRTESDGYQP